MIHSNKKKAERLPPIGKNYQYDWGATNSVYKKDKLKMAKNFAKEEMDLEDDLSTS